MSSRRIVERAHELGFERVGVVPLRPPRHLAEFDAWLDAEMHGEMGYMKTRRDLRADPRRLHEGAECAIVVAMSHRPAHDEGEAGGLARYARGRDYHKVMRKRLTALGQFVDGELGEGGCRPRPYVDSAPILERDLAESAGVGWFGKNTNILDQTYGSYIFLGELFVGSALEEVSHRAPDRCGRCTACIDLCPTKAIVAPYKVDARLCISYLTIELRGVIPRELRALIGDHLFGCDICQIVCPWNRKALPTQEAAFGPRPEIVGLSAADLLRLTPTEFDTVFVATPIRRTGWAAMARNAAIVLGNSGDRRVIPTLVGELREHQSALVRLHCAWALSMFSGESARLALEMAHSGEPSNLVADEIDWALAQNAP